MRDVWLAGAGIIFGWLMSKAWSDPGCQMGLVVFLVATAVLVLPWPSSATAEDRMIRAAIKTTMGTDPHGVELKE